MMINCYSIAILEMETGSTPHEDFYPDKYSDMAFKMGVNAVIYALSPEQPVHQSRPRIPDALKKLQQRLEHIEETD